MQAEQIGLTWIVVDDLQKAIDYYTKTIGFKLCEVNPKYGWAELLGQKGGARLGLAEKSDHMTLLPGANAVFSVSVANLEEAKEEAIQGGSTPIGDIMEIPGHVKLLLCQDPDGNHFHLAQKLD